VEYAMTKSHSRLALACLALVLIATAALRLSLLDVPLERDEGEYAYGGQLLLAGELPYLHLYNMKWPGIYAAYALVIAVFGETTRAIHLGLLLVNAFSIALVFMLARRLADDVAAVTAAMSFAILALLPSVHGTTASAEHFVMAQALAGACALVWSLDRGSDGAPPSAGLLAAGFFFGAAALMKQQGAVFAVMAGLYVLIERPSRGCGIRAGFSDAGLLAIGGMAPLLASAAVLHMGGAFEKFWFWTVTYGATYVGQTPLEKGVQNLVSRSATVVQSAPALFWLAGLGLVAIGFDRRKSARPVFRLLFTLASFLAILPGLRFRPHYFVLALPGVALLVGYGMSAVATRLPSSPWARVLPIVITLAAVLTTTFENRRILLTMTPHEVSRRLYGLNPFPESGPIGDYLRENSEPTDRIVVLGSEPQIYFYSRRRSATAYIYTYALMENHPYAREMQEEMIAQITSAQPKFLVYVSFRSSWTRDLSSEWELFSWYERFVEEHYRPVGIVKVSLGRTDYVWDESLVLPKRKAPYVAVFERK
jgi:hypothetical protein